MRVPYLAKPHIAGCAEALIRRHARGRGREPAPPVPVEDIVERTLGLELGFVDFQRVCGLDDVLGATYVAQRRIRIDERLASGRQEGRYCFTCAHETGHWVLHRHLVVGDGAKRPAILCRIRDARAPIEWQADYFAACLLMPESLLRPAFSSIFGASALILFNVQSAYAGPACFDPCADNWPYIADALRQRGGFSNVSKQAMILRLLELGLVVNRTRKPLTWEDRVPA